MHDDVEGIRRTLALYCQLMDDARYDEVADLFTTDGRWNVQGSEHVGNQAIRSVMASWPGPSGTKHITANSVIDIDGDTASSVSDFVLFQPSPVGGVAVRAGRYRDSLRKDPTGQWLFARRENLGESLVTS